MKWNLVLKIVFVLVLITTNKVNAFECKSIEACIALIPEIHDKELRYWDQVDDSVKIKLQSFGRKALIPLSKLTNESNHNRRSVADSLISDIKDLKDEDFSIIRKVIDNNIKFDGNGGNAYGALGYISSDGVGKYLISELKRVQSSDNSIGTAFRRLGVKGLPFIIEGLRCFESCNPKDFNGFYNIFRPHYGIKILDDKSATQLFDIAKNEKIDMHARKAAMSLIGYITKNSQLAHKLYKYAKVYPDLLSSVFTSLESMKSPLAAKILVEQLSFDRNEPVFFNSKDFSPLNDNSLIFSNLSKIGISANSFGSEIMPYLNSASWDDRVHSAITLGYIGYSQAIPELLKLLPSKHDWIQSYAVIKALHLLGAKSTIPHIEKIANSHWYSPLRKYAKKVVVSLQSNELTQSKYRTGNFSFDFVDYQLLAQKNHRCDQSDYEKIVELAEYKLYRTRNDNLKPFSYKNPECSNIDYRNYYKDYCLSSRSIISPSFATKFGEQWLVGDNRGEWGGELMLFEQGKAPKALLTENIEDVYVVGEYAYIISGLAHMSSNNGLIYKIEEIDSEYLIEPFYRLPGAPRKSWKVDDDSFLINTIFGGVIFNLESGLQMAECTAK